MAPETKAKKRKSAELSAPSSKKSKKSDVQSEDVAASKPSKKANRTAPASEEPLPATSTKSKSSRKRAVDFFDGEEEGGVKLELAATPKSMKSKKVKHVEEPEETVAVSTKTSNRKKAQKSVEDAPVPSKIAKESAKRTKKQATPEESSNDEPADETAVAAENGGAHEVEEEEDDEVDDQTAALLKGFESSSDEEDASEDEGDSVAIDKTPSLPNEKKLRKTLDAASKSESDGPGVVYVGRIPHGFYEHQMQAYFSQFGQITRLRLSRNAKTGRSKHYAFIEFAHASVARIVADTMDKYLMFGHILQVKLLGPEQVHPELFKGAGRRFKKVPRNKIEGRRLRLGMEREAWEGRIGREEKRRKEKEEKVKAMGYDFEAPKLRSVGDVPMKDAATDGASAIEAADGIDAVKALPEVSRQEESGNGAVETAKSEQETVAVPEKAKTKSTKPKSSGAGAEKAVPAKKTKKASSDAKVKKVKKVAP